MKDVREASCLLTTGVCGHQFHFHCLSSFLKRNEVCPVDGTPWHFSRYGDRDPKQRICHKSHPVLYRTISEYRVIRCAGRFDPVSFGLLQGIHHELIVAEHPYARAFGKCIERLPEGGMMISFDDWEWIFRFLDKLAVSDVRDMDVAGFEKPPAWMRREQLRGERSTRQDSPHQPTKKAFDRLHIECNLLAESAALKDLVDWDSDTLQLFAEGRKGRELRGSLHFLGNAYPIHIGLRSDWPFQPPVINFPAARPPIKVAFRIDSAGDLQTGPSDWCPALTVEKWLLMIVADVLDPGRTVRMELPIEFQDPFTMLPGERNSKLLQPDSALVQRLSAMRERLMSVYGPTTIKGDRPWHIELNRPLSVRDGSTSIVAGRLMEEVQEKVLSRAAQLQGRIIPVDDKASFAIMGKAFVFNTPAVESYGPTHVTVAYFPNGLPGSVDELFACASVGSCASLQM